MTRSLAHTFLCVTIFITGCQNRSVDVQKDIPGSVVSIEKFEDVYWGGACLSVDGKVSETNCYREDSPEIHSYVAKNVEVETFVVPAKSGGGYVARFNFSDTLPPLVNKDQTSVHWSIYLDSQNQNKPPASQIDDFLGALVNHSIPSFEKPEFVSETLPAGKTYTFYLTGQVVGSSFDQRILVIQVLYARVVIDLRSVQETK